MMSEHILDHVPLGTPFEATLNGVRSRFVKVEHVNIGEGWMCRELDGKMLPGGYLSTKMKDFFIPVHLSNEVLMRITAP